MKKLHEAETKLLLKATSLKVTPSASGKGSSSSVGSGGSGGSDDKLEDLFEDLPKMPPGRRRFPSE